MIQKILVADDSPTDLLNLQKILIEAGYVVLTASSGREAIDKAITDEPDMIFLDIVMADLDGYRACREISKERRDTPIVFVSSKNQRADKIWAKAQGGKGFVSKPYTSQQIIEQVDLLQA